jgi:hypothetical protein
MHILNVGPRLHSLNNETQFLRRLKKNLVAFLQSYFPTVPPDGDLKTCCMHLSPKDVWLTVGHGAQSVLESHLPPLQCTVYASLTSHHEWIALIKPLFTIAVESTLTAQVSMNGISSPICWYLWVYVILKTHHLTPWQRTVRENRSNSLKISPTQSKHMGDLVADARASCMQELIRAA